MPGEQPSLWIALLSAALLSGAAVGCGAPAAPLPPTLNLPQPVHSLAATRIGDTVRLTFPVPEKTTDKLPVRGAVTAVLCRSLGNGPCQPAGRQVIPAQARLMVLEDALPADLTQGATRLLTYKVNLLNRAGQSAGDSAPAYAAAGAAPPSIAGLTATPRRNGIVLSWQGTGSPADVVRLDRTRISPAETPPTVPGRPFAAGKAPETPLEQSFRIPETHTERRFSTLDSTAAVTGTTYRYVAQRIENVTLDGHALQIVSQPAAPVETEYRDIFPPPIPTGLVSAADSAQKAIDLNWTPDVDAGLAGYFVYRRPAGSTEQPQRVSPDQPVRSPAWRDITALPGQRYAYSVSAIDTSGNESQRSAEVEDEWSADTIGPASKP